MSRVSSRASRSSAAIRTASRCPWRVMLTRSCEALTRSTTSDRCALTLASGIVSLMTISMTTSALAGQPGRTRGVRPGPGDHRLQPQRQPGAQPYRFPDLLAQVLGDRGCADDREAPVVEDDQ